MQPDELIQLVKDSGLRGRGGAGFPTGMKWGFIPQGDGKPHYLVVNADESEPGTCKDIPLMMASPHTLVEGVIIASYAIRANHAFIYIRGEVAPRRPPAAARGARGLRRRLPRQEHPRLRLRPRARRARRRRRLHLRRGDRAARLARGLPRPAAAAPAVPRRRRSLRLPDRGQQRRVDRERAVRSSHNGADWFASMGTEKSQGLRPLLAVRPRHQARPVRGAARHHAARAARAGRRHPRGPRAEVLDAGRLVAPRCSPTSTSTSRSTSRASARPARCSAPARCRSSTRRPASCAPCCGGPSSTSTSRAASARRAARAPTGWSRCCGGSRTARAREADLATAARPVRQHPRPLVLRARRRRDAARSPRRSSTSATSTSPTSTGGGCPFDPASVHPVRQRGSALHDRDDDSASRGERPATADDRSP